MIETPRKSVTRFFIPLIDVLILLFCIFLLMPFVSAPTGAPGEPPAVEPKDATADAVEKLQTELAAARRRIDEMRKQRADLSERLSVRVLEIDKATGNLSAFDPDAGGRVPIRDAADAQRVINQQRARAGAKDVFVLILYPRELSGYPLREQVETYRRWFKDVPHGFDNPYLSTPP